MNNLSKRIIGVVVALAVVAIAGAGWFRGGGSQANLGAINQANPPANTANEKVALTVDDQFPGSVIFVSSVTLPSGGWVVIERDNNGAIGAVVGAGYFGKNVLTGEVNLPTSTKEGEKYFAVLYRDNGNQSFDLATDTVYRDDHGQPVAVPLTITRNLPEKKG